MDDICREYFSPSFLSAYICPSPATENGLHSNDLFKEAKACMMISK